MTKNVSACAIAVFMALALVACGGDSGSPTSPSQSSTATSSVDLSKKIYVRIARFVPDKLTVDVYGSLGYGLDSSNRNRDLNGSTLRLRVFENDTKFTTFVVGVYNSA